MQIVLRPALIQDFDFCKNLYFAGMEDVIRELNLDRDRSRRHCSSQSGFQRRGIGTEVIGRLIAEAGDLPVTLSVAKINPAVRLYERLGFQITHEDARKFHMRHEPDR